ncbi:MAG: CPXCG motif-containing cysteine-rich protein [Pirellulaceae bacterium]
MSHEEFYGTVNFFISAALVPWGDPSEYVHSVVGKALDLNEEDVGTITLKLVSTTEAENLGQRLVDVCDADSAILEAIYATLFDMNGETNEELDIEPGWNNLLLVEAVEIKSSHEFTTLRVQLIETGIAMFCPAGLVVAVQDSLALSIDDWRRLGFARIAKSPFVFRDQLKLNPYERKSARIVDEASYTCDGCGEEIVIPLDLSQGEKQEYVEDCPVCCRANLIHVEIEEDGAIRVWAEPEQDNE